MRRFSRGKGTETEVTVAFRLVRDEIRGWSVNGY